MAQEFQEQEFSRPAIIELQAFERALRAAHDDLWWLEFIKLIKERRSAFLETLATQRQDMRTEDTIRGQISELSWILALDQVGAPPKERRNVNQSSD
jgi:hypothetical protein